ncbi:glycosyltransferase family 2 protein [Winogradskyella costae]|uniref:glycosyltransferase family 2 protein n=1 Tax=Winogradskyella costae TaxID=2697008 RepID=UPI0015CA0EE6|nr:glycosyltransferase family A protein [Winogradskyella costae]
MINTNSPLVSVLMTVYNREEYIAEAIESVINSTYKDWELIIVDDRSTDNSLEIAKKYEATDVRIKVYINETNLGDYPNRNKAATYAKGEYLKYVDADDMIYPYGLELLVYYMLHFPNADYGLCSIEQDYEHKFPIELNPYETYNRHYIQKKHIFHKAPLSSIIKRKIFNEVGGFSNVRHYGDFDLWHRLAQKYSVLLMPHGIVWYRVSNGQEGAIRKKNPMNIAKTIHAAHMHCVSDDSPLSKLEKEALDKVFLKQKSDAILSGFKRFGWSKGVEMKRFLKLSYVEIIKFRIN